MYGSLKSDVAALLILGLLLPQTRDDSANQKHSECKAREEEAELNNAHRQNQVRIGCGDKAAADERRAEWRTESIGLSSVGLGIGVANAHQHQTDRGNTGGNAETKD